MKQKMYVDANEISRDWGISKSKSYQIIKSLNQEMLKKKGQSFFSWDCHHIVYWLVTPPLTGWKSNAVRLLPTAKNSRTI